MEEALLLNGLPRADASAIRALVPEVGVVRRTGKVPRRILGATSCR